jgi:pyruvate,water dikinase
MDELRRQGDRLVWLLKERAKELNCLYKVEELLFEPDSRIETVCKGIIDAIPAGWLHPEFCTASIALDNVVYAQRDFKETPWVLSVEIQVSGKIAGAVNVYYVKELPDEDIGPFLKEEKKLLETIAERLGSFVSYQRMRRGYQEYKAATQGVIDDKKSEWRIVLDLLRQTDRLLFLSISQKMLNHLCWTGIEDAQRLVQYYSPDEPGKDEELSGAANRPNKKKSPLIFNDFLSDETFKIASDHLTSEELLSFIQRWIQQSKLSFLVESLENLGTSLSMASESIRRYQRMVPDGVEMPPTTKKGVLVSLIRRFFSDQLDFINVAKNCIEIEDFFELLQNVIFTKESHGRLGGKSAGLFLAEKILTRCAKDKGIPTGFKTPKTWYITSDALFSFINYNNFEEVIEQKYKDISQIRIEYPNIVQTFKNAHFPPEIMRGLSMALDDFKDKPLIVRSSSLLEDRAGAAFSGKYKSLFLANQGTKEEKLDALLDAVAEVYASIFGPDPIEYRAERGLIDFHEEMGIMIQEVVGARAGKYFMPAYAGVAFSKNEFRWSSRIKREDGLVRLVPGLGTRAVDRVSDDFPILVSPGQPGLRVNVTVDEAIKYSPKKIDVINLETNTFETMEISRLMNECGNDFPIINQIISIVEDEHIHPPVGLSFDIQKSDSVITFEGLFTKTSFIGKMQNILKTLEEKLGTSIDIEFASDGCEFYLLQCRPQSHSDGNIAVPIPKDISAERMVFTANRFVSNGRVPDITHIVYVDPQSYSEIGDRITLLSVGQAVSKLNMVLPKRQFVLMGPGRWGSRGDIRLGVSVTYSDINNTAVLIEIARKSGNYVPDLSFGTHFFQDLVEANIRYLPLYPDDSGIVFNENFLKNSPNILQNVLPEFGSLANTIHLIDVPSVTNGRILQILMNADLDEAVGILTQPHTAADAEDEKHGFVEQQVENYWIWRLRMAERIASLLDPERFGVKGLYLFGSTKNATAGPASDIDILVHFCGNDQQRDALTAWMQGWSLALDQMNYLQTGYRTGGLLDVHIITDDDIAQQTSYAIKIGAVTDPARQLPLMKHSD